MTTKLARVSAVRRVADLPSHVCNLEVEGTHNFFVDGVLTHNCDDPHNVRQSESPAERAQVHSFWFEAIPSRLDKPDHGVKVIVQQRVHEKDLAGECLKRGYYPVVVPARSELNHPQRHPKDPRPEGEPLWPTRMSDKTLNALATEMGSYAAAGQLQQRPAPREGGMFKKTWFQVEAAAPARAIMTAVRRWDLAGTEASGVGSDPDWTAGVKMGKDELGRYWVLDVVRFRDSASKVEQAIKAIAQQDGTGCTIGLPQDPGQAGKHQAGYLIRQLAPFTARATTETGDKATRATPFSAQAEAGNVFMVKGDWNEDFLDELASFPNASHDDQVDAAAGAFGMLHDSGGGMLEWMRQQASGMEAQAPSSHWTVERMRLAGR